MISRRTLIGGLTALTGAAASGLMKTAHADANATPASPGIDDRGGRPWVPVWTPNGRTLPYKRVGGVKEFHLTAAEFEHEFAPGCKALCWGYNGSTPGPTIEAVEGDRVRILVTNHLREHTTVHWHGILLPNGMDGVGGLTQPQIKPGETWAYEFTLRQAGTHMYHPHADEMVQMAMGMMGMFIIHPKNGYEVPVDRDITIMLMNWALHPGTRRPDPSVMTDFDLWTLNGKVYPATAPIPVGLGERVRVRFGNLSMWNHPMHLHGHRYWVTGSDGDRWPRSAWKPETTEIVAVGQCRDIEFVADNPGDWAFHCHMAHHTMNAMSHTLPNPIGVDAGAVEKDLNTLLPGTMLMGRNGMADMSAMRGVQGPPNTLPMMMGKGPYGSIEMGGMFTVLKVRDGLKPGDYADPGWYHQPPGTQARRVAFDPRWAVSSGMAGTQMSDDGGLAHPGDAGMQDMPGMSHP